MVRFIAFFTSVLVLLSSAPLELTQHFCESKLIDSSLTAAPKKCAHAKQKELFSCCYNDYDISISCCLEKSLDLNTVDFIEQYFPNFSVNLHFTIDRIYCGLFENKEILKPIEIVDPPPLISEVYLDVIQVFEI